MKTLLCIIAVGCATVLAQEVTTTIGGVTTSKNERPARKAEAIGQRAVEEAEAIAKEAAWQQAFVSATNLCQRILGLTVKTGAEFKSRAAEIAMTAIIKADAGTISANDLAALNARLFALDILSR